MSVLKQTKSRTPELQKCNLAGLVNPDLKEKGSFNNEI